MKLHKKYFFIFFLGILIGIQFVRKNWFPYNMLRKWKKSRKQVLNNDAFNYPFSEIDNIKVGGLETILIPVEYYPKYLTIEDEYGKRSVLVSGVDTLKASTNNVGLVLVDIHNTGDELSPIEKNQKLFLERVRETNMQIIHAPNEPVVSQYGQYHKIKKIVQDSLNKYEKNNKYPIFLKNSDYVNEIWEEERRIRKNGKVPVYIENPVSERFIGKDFTPNMDEYVINSHEELRYVIWMHDIKLLLYMGGAMNECMLLRPTGIINLKHDRINGNPPLPITIVSLDDCSYVGGSHIDNKIFKKSISEFYKQNISFISKSNQIKFY